MSSPCCIAAAWNFHSLFHSHAILSSLFSAMLLPKLHLAIFHQPSDSRLFFLCLLNLSHSSTAIPFSAQGTTPSLSCMFYLHHNFMQFTALFFFHSKEGSWIKTFFANSSPPIPHLMYSCSLASSSLIFSTRHSILWDVVCKESLHFGPSFLPSPSLIR